MPLRNRNPLTLLGVAIAITACAPSATMEQTWTAPTAHSQPPLTKVVAMFISSNVTIRRSGEDKLALDLKAKGVDATPAYAILSEEEALDLATTGDPQKPDLAVKAKLRTMGYDGLVTMRVVDRELQVENLPLTYSGYWGYPGWGYDSPGYVASGAYTVMTYHTETNAYSLRTDQLVWSGIVKTVDPNNTRELINRTTQAVASQLTKRGLAG